MMKKLLLFTTLLSIAFFVNAQNRATISSNGTGGGDWNVAATWNPAQVPVNVDDVTILSGDVVTSTTAVAASTVTVNTGATLTINSGAELTTGGNVVVSGTLNQNGILNAGDAVDDMFHIFGGTFAVGSNSTTTIAGYYKQEVDGTNVGTIGTIGGTVTNVTINVANVGPFTDNTNNIFFFGDGCVSSLTGSAVNINIVHGNSGTAKEVAIGIATGINPGNGVFKLGNGSSTVTDWYMVNNSSLGNVKLDIGAGNTMHFSHSVPRTNTVVFFGLNITSGTFRIEPAMGLKVVYNNTLTVGASGNLVLASDATGAGSLIFYDDADDVNATVERYIVGNQWHLITPTTTGATTADLFQNYNPNVHLQEWVEASQTWEYIVDPDLNAPLPVGKGYSVLGSTVSRVDDFVFSSTGNLESTDFIVSKTLGAEEFTLVGNPFSSTVRVVTGTGLNGNTGFYNEIWIWNPGTGLYATYTGGTGGTILNGEVARGQGFFVKSNAVSPQQFTMLETERRFGAVNNFLKSGGTIDWNDNYGIGDYVMLKVSDGEITDGVFVNFGEYGTPGFENNYDGFKRFGYNTSPQLYLVEDDLNLTIDYLSPLVENEERIVNLNFRAGKNGEHVLAANLDSLISTRVTLEDTKTGMMHEFNSGSPYTFNASTEDAYDRFLLHFMYNLTGIEDPANSESAASLNIYAYNKAVYIANNDNNTTPSEVTMYDLVGRQIYSNRIELGTSTRIPVNVKNTYLVVKVIKGSEVVTQKVFIK